MGEQATYGISEAIESGPRNVQLSYFDKAAFDLVVQSGAPAAEKAALFAEMARLNILYMVTRAGSGHLGSSFSSLDIVTWLYLNVLKPEDRYFSSKGHDVPGLYAVQAALGIIPFDKIHVLRRLNGLPGHPDVKTAGAHTNTGSLGMGVSKAKGLLFADDLLRRPRGRVFVLTGDGELQEGQFWESLISASRRRDGRLTVIVDHNKVQSDTYVASVSDLGDLAAKFRAFGWDVCRCDGHDYTALDRVIGSPGVEGKPKAIIADTIKGRGVSFMEHTAMHRDHSYYRYHSGAPSHEDYRKAREELLAAIKRTSERLAIPLPDVVDAFATQAIAPENTERLIPAYSEALLAEARANPLVVALDADLILDTGLIPFKEEFPDRFVECGIAEQDMVSQAGTMALTGLVPVVHSFACFLTSRASEQIYNNCTQGRKVIYVGSLAGVLPGGPGHSHQAIRDIAAMSAMPGMVIVEPVNTAQVTHAVRWSINDAPASVYIRMTSVPFGTVVARETEGLPSPGQGVVVRAGTGVVVLVAGPVLLSEAVKAVDQLGHAHAVTVISMPWLNYIDRDWLNTVITDECSSIVVLENHSTQAGFGAYVLSTLALTGLAKNRSIVSIGVEGVPLCGSNAEVLSSHRLDSASIGDVLAGLRRKTGATQHLV